MAEPGAVVDIVRAESRPHQLLKEVGFLIRALGRTKTGQRLLPLRIADLLQSRGRAIERLFPRGLAEVSPRIRGIHLVVGFLRDVVEADQRLRQPMRMVNVVESEAALDAKTVAVGGSVAS